MSIVNWEYYSSLFSTISEENFEKAESLAEKEVQRVVGAVKWAHISPETFGYEQLKDCICKVMDKVANDERSGLGKGLSSVSNDGYSESYAITGSSELQEELARSIRVWLSGTGLVGAY